MLRTSDAHPSSQLQRIRSKPIVQPRKEKTNIVNAKKPAIEEKESRLRYFLYALVLIWFFAWLYTGGLSGQRRGLLGNPKTWWIYKRLRRHCRSKI